MWVGEGLMKMGMFLHGTRCCMNESSFKDLLSRKCSCGVMVRTVGTSSGDTWFKPCFSQKLIVVNVSWFRLYTRYLLVDLDATLPLSSSHEILIELSAIYLVAKAIRNKLYIAPANSMQIPFNLSVTMECILKVHLHWASASMLRCH